jgi:hypothetical protein
MARDSTGGWLLKRSDGRLKGANKWDRRQFVRRGRFLFYYSDDRVGKKEADQQNVAVPHLFCSVLFCFFFVIVFFIQIRYTKTMFGLCSKRVIIEA